MKLHTQHLTCLALSTTLLLNYLAVNIGLHTVTEILIYALPALLIPLFFLLFTIWILERRLPNSLKGSGSLLMFITFGAVVEPHRQTNPEMPLILFWSYVIPLLLIAIFIGWYFGKKAIQPLFVFLVVFGAERAYQMTIKIYERWEKQSYIESAQYQKESANYFNTSQNEKPFAQRFNVYHILIDSYPSLEGLKRFGGNNEAFYQKLESKGFRAYRHAFSNYPNTRESLISMWRMQHTYNNSDHNSDPYSLYGRNESFRRFIQEGYQIYCDYPCYSETQSPSQPVSSKIKSHLLLRNDRFLQYYMLYYLGPMISTLLGTAEKPQNSLAQEWLLLQDQLQNPAFVYLHDLSHQAHHKNSREKLNRSMLQIVDDISQKQEPHIMIFSSDHGNRKEWASRHFKKETPLDNFGILLAVRWPSRCASFHELKRITPVNLYRYIFACLEGSPAPSELEPDNSYMKGKTLLEALSIGKTNYLHIQDHKPLITPQVIKKIEILENLKTQANP